MRIVLLLTICLGASQMPGVRFAEDFLGGIQLRERRLGRCSCRSHTQAEVRFAVAGLQLQRRLENLSTAYRGSVQIVQHEAAIHVTGGHFWIAFEREAEILQRRLQVAVVGMTFPAMSGRSLSFCQDRLVFRDQGERFIVAAEIIQVVGEVHHAFAVVGQLRRDAYRRASRTPRNRP